MSEKEERAKAFQAMKKLRAKPDKKISYNRKYRTAGSDKRSGVIGNRNLSLAEAIYKSND